MNKLGTWTSLDCPTEKQSEARQFLQLEFAYINGTVRRVSNPHDFGSYPSFEIDMPATIRDHDDCDDNFTCETCAHRDDWIEKANAIEKAYGDKFAKWL